MQDKYIIEARGADGQLLLGDYPQPQSVFGMKAITGITDWEMSRVIFAKDGDAILNGDNIRNWPRLINPNWVAREKSW